jgi:hypothetical protein
MKRVYLILALFLGFIIGCNGTPIVCHTEFSSLPVWHPSYQTTYVEEYDAGGPEENELENVQCPIPMECRVKNYTGIQCVFSSLECLGRWAEIKELTDPPLTSRSNCKSYSGPADAANKIKSLGIKFENVYGNKKKAIDLLKRAMAEGRGALMDIPGHAIVICHYDENNKIVKIIDNSDRSLKIQTWSMDKFNRLWNGWIMVVYSKNDLFPGKVRQGSLPNQIPIIDKNNPQGIYSDGYIPVPAS